MRLGGLQSGAAQTRAAPFYLPKPTFQSLPRGTKIYTPTRRLARVDSVDENGRVHVTYCNGRVDGHAEEACFPLSLVKESDICNTRDTHVQHTCGKGDASLEYKPRWIYDQVGRKRGAP